MFVCLLVRLFGWLVGSVCGGVVLLVCCVVVAVSGCV